MKWTTWKDFSNPCDTTGCENKTEYLVSVHGVEYYYCLDCRQEESEGKREKLQVEVLAKARSIEQEQQKIDDSRDNNDFNNALELLKIELQEQKDLNKQLMSNIPPQ